MATFKDSYRLERVYFEKLKSMIDILKSFLDSETDEKTRAILTNEIDDNGAILLLYRNLGEAWAELADLIQKLRNDLNDLDEKEEAYHDELNERIDEVNNYLMALIRELQARMDTVEADLAQMGRLFTYDLTRAGAVYTLSESGNAVTFADTVAKFTHVRPHFVAVRNGANYYLIDTYDLTTGTGAITWSGWKFTAAGEIVQTVVALNADNSVSVTETATNFTAILSRLTSLESRVDTLEDCCEEVGETLEDIEEALEGKQDILTAGDNITIDNNVISAAGGGIETITPTQTSEDWIDGLPWDQEALSYAYMTFSFGNLTSGSFYTLDNTPILDALYNAPFSYIISDLTNVCAGIDNLNQNILEAGPAYFYYISGREPMLAAIPIEAMDTNTLDVENISVGINYFDETIYLSTGECVGYLIIQSRIS